MCILASYTPSLCMSLLHGWGCITGCDSFLSVWLLWHMVRSHCLLCTSLQLLQPPTCTSPYVYTSFFTTIIAGLHYHKLVILHIFLSTLTPSELIVFQFYCICMCNNFPHALYHSIIHTQDSLSNRSAVPLWHGQNAQAFHFS